MPPVYKFRTPDGVKTEMTQYFRELTLDVTTNAEEGSNAQSTVQADDPDGTFDLVGHRVFTVQEDTAPAASSNSHIYVGYSAARRISRGPYHRTQAGRVWDIDLVDLNSVLPRRIMDGADSNRPAETDVARVTWLLGTNEASLIDDSLYFNTSGGVAMDAVDYRGQRFDQILDDCGQASGKNWFVWYREENGKYSLWYDLSTSTNYTSIIRLSNVLTDIDNEWTFGIAEDTELTRSPDRVNSGVYLDYDGGHVYEQRIATARAFAQRDASVPAENVKTAAKATTRARRYLDDMDSEDDIITTSFICPAAKVNFLMQGMRVQFRASHLPGYDTFSWCRVLNRTVKQVSEEFYQINMDLVPTPVGSKVLLAVVNRGAPVGQTPAAPTDNSTHPWTLLYWSGDFCTVPRCGATPAALQAVGIYVRDVVPGESTSVLRMVPSGLNAAMGIWVHELGGVIGGANAVSLVTGTHGVVANGGSKTLSASASRASVLFGTIAWGKVSYDAGWCAGGLDASAILTTTGGTELVNKSAANDCGEGLNPWSWQAYATGSGSLSVTVQTLAGNYGAGAYTCGWNTGQVAILAPVDDFSIIQTGHDSTAVLGEEVTVVMPALP